MIHQEKQHTIARRSNAIEQRANFGIGKEERRLSYLRFFRKRKKHLIPAQDSLIKEFNRSDHLLKLGGGKQNGLSFYIAK